MAEEELCDELFSREFLLRNVPAAFHATRKSRKLVMHCDVAELSLQPHSAGFQRRINRPPPSAGDTKSSDANKTGEPSANPSLLSHYHRDTLTTRGTHIFVFTDWVCFGHRATDTKILPPSTNHTNAENRETWHFDRTIGFLLPSSVHHREYPDFPRVLVLKAKPGPTFETTLSEAASATLPNALSNSIISLVPAGRGDRKLWSELWNALKTTVVGRHEVKPLDLPLASPICSGRLHRPISFWLHRIDDVADNSLSLKAGTQATYFL